MRDGLFIRVIETGPPADDHVINVTKIQSVEETGPNLVITMDSGGTISISGWTLDQFVAFMELHGRTVEVVTVP